MQLITLTNVLSELIANRDCALKAEITKILYYIK